MGLHDHISPDELDALADRIAAEDTRAESDPEVPEADRVVSGHKAFADHRVAPRDLDGIPYDEFGQ